MLQVLYTFDWNFSNEVTFPRDGSVWTKCTGKNLRFLCHKKVTKAFFTRGGNIISCPPKRWNFFEMLSSQPTTPLRLIIYRDDVWKSPWTCVSSFEYHISLSRFIIVFSLLHSSCFCRAFSSYYGNATSRLAAFEIKTPNLGMQIKPELFLFVEAHFLHLQLWTMFDVSEFIICSSERTRSPRYCSFIMAASEDITQQNSKCRRRIEVVFF